MVKPIGNMFAMLRPVRESPSLSLGLSVNAVIKLSRIKNKSPGLLGKKTFPGDSPQPPKIRPRPGEEALKAILPSQGGNLNTLWAWSGMAPGEEPPLGRKERPPSPKQTFQLNNIIFLFYHQLPLSLNYNPSL